MKTEKEEDELKFNRNTWNYLAPLLCLTNPTKKKFGTLHLRIIIFWNFFSSLIYKLSSHTKLYRWRTWWSKKFNGFVGFWCFFWRIYGKHVEDLFVFWKCYKNCLFIFLTNLQWRLIKWDSRQLENSCFNCFNISSVI